MAINYNGFIGNIGKTKDNHIFTVEAYLGLKSSKHKYRIRFAINGKVKVVDYNQIKNGTVTFSFTKPKSKSKAKSKTKTTTLVKNKIDINSNYGVFSLDLATKLTGYAYLSGTSYIESGVISKSDSNKFKRINRMIDEVMFRIKQHKVDMVVIEDIFLSSHNSTGVTSYKALANIQGAMVDRLIAENYNYHLIMPSEWRASFFKGKYNREECKKMAVEYVRDVMGMNLQEDECEALMIGLSYIKKNKC